MSKRISLIAAVLCAACSSTPESNQAIDRPLRIGSQAYQSGQLVDARMAFQRATTAATLYDDNARLADAWLAKAASEVLLGEFAAAEQSYRTAKLEAIAGNVPDKVLQADIGLAETTRRQGQLAAAQAQYENLRQKSGLTVTNQTQVDLGLALCLLADGQLDAAEKLLQPWLARQADLPPASRSAVLANTARLRMAQGENAKASELAQAALEIDREARNPPAIAADHALLAEIFQRAGRSDEEQWHLGVARRIQSLTGQKVAP